MNTVNKDELEHKIKIMYREVALNPDHETHFEMGRELAERLGYPAKDLESLPEEAIDSFAGVGYHFDLAQIKNGESVLDLGSGSGMDVFFAAMHVGSEGDICGVDMTEEQLKISETLSKSSNISNVSFHESYIESLPFEDNRFDVVISNGVINLSAEKEIVFQEIARVLKPEGRMVISDIVSEKQLTESIVCDANLWASCIGGATQEDKYRDMIEKTGLRIIETKENSEYQFLSKAALGASKDFGVKSISLLAQKF